MAIRVPDAAQRANLQRALARWFAAERRDLPWRRTRDPYAIWVSEAMLQQTRVETVLPYYRRFLERFPTLATLAAAEEDEVLALWSGLGYYSRARALVRAARVVALQHGGRFPRTPKAWLALPGVGPYTAGAVLSIAFGLSVPLVDGNVARVLARLFALEAPLGSKEFTRAAWELAGALVPAAGESGDPGQWNQALMELGARVCTSRAPRCEVCPVSARCAARRAGRSGELPRRAPRRAPIEVALEIFVVRRGPRLLVQRRRATGRMAGLWELPTRELPCASERPRVGLWPGTLAGLALVPGVELGRLRHTITHHRIRATLRRARWTGGRARGDSLRWARADELERLAVTGLTKKALALASGAPQAARAP